MASTREDGDGLQLYVDVIVLEWNHLKVEQAEVERDD
jgi:hypothetical protein